MTKKRTNSITSKRVPIAVILILGQENSPAKYRYQVAFKIRILYRIHESTRYRGMCKYRYIKVQLSGIGKILSKNTYSLSLIPARCFFPPGSQLWENLRARVTGSCILTYQ
jgi:hypothetical protein